MTEESIEKIIFSMGKVKKHRLENLKASRYLFHDVPFAVIMDVEQESVLHVRLTRQKRQEVLVRFSKIFMPSDFYDPRYWVMVIVSAEMPEALVYDAVSDAYTRIFRALPPLSRILDSESFFVKYDLDYKRAISDMEKPLRISYGMHIPELDNIDE